MADKEEKTTSSTKVSKFVESKKTVLITALIAVVVAIVVFIVVDVVKSNVTKKNLSVIDEISYTLTKDSASLEDSELDARRKIALESLESYTKKGGITGVRANMLCAEIAYQEEDYENALAFWQATSKKGKGSYTTPIADYNIGVCYEELGKLDEAAEAYKKAADANEFLLATHAYFSYGRTLETQGKYADAVAAYKELNDKNPDDSWAKIAKSRIILLQSEGKAE